MVLTVPPGGDAGLTEACGVDPGAVCEAVWNATGSEGWSKAADWFIGRPLTIIVIIVVAWIASRLSRRAVRRAVHRIMESNASARSWALQRVGVDQSGAAVTDPRREGRAAAISAVLASTVTVLIWTIALIMVLGEFNVDLAPLLAGAGIAGVALGFGAQSLVKDCISGLFMLIEDQYGIGDDVDLGEAVGTVDQITLRTTVLRGADGTLWHVPNGQVMRVGNRSALWTVAMLDVVVGPGADIELASRVVSETAKRICETEEFAPVVLEAPELLGVESITAEGVTLRLRIKTRPGSQFALQRALREAEKDALDAAGIPPPRAPWAPQHPGP
jgi:moderate conductance mechanosensitive channel